MFAFRKILNGNLQLRDLSLIDRKLIQSFILLQEEELNLKDKIHPLWKLTKRECLTYLIHLKHKHSVQLQVTQDVQNVISAILIFQATKTFTTLKVYKK